MTNSLKLRLVPALVAVAVGLYVHQHPSFVPSAIESVAGLVGISTKIDTLLIIDETAVVPTYGKGNHPGWHDIIGSATLKESLAAKGIKLIGPIDKNVTGKFPSGVGEVLASERDTAVPRAIGLSGGKVKFNVILPDTEVAVIKKAGG